MKRILSIFLACTGLLLFAGCDQGDTVAEVNGKKISKVEFAQYLKLKNIDEKESKKVERALDSYLQREALAIVIEKEGKLNHESIEAEVREFRKQLLINRYFEQVVNDKVSEQAIRNYYTTHKDQYQVKKVRVAHILIRTNPGMSENERKALLTKAQEIHSRLTANGKFETQAKKYSEDRNSAKKGGDLGWLREGAIDPAFSGKIFTMKQGEISQPFATPFGFHIVKVLEAPTSVMTPFEKVRGNIRYQLKQQAKEAEKKRLGEKIKIESTTGKK